MADIERMKRALVNADKAGDTEAAKAIAKALRAAMREGDAQAPESEASQALRGKLSEFTQNPARGQYETMPEWKKAATAAADVVDIGVDGLTMGLGNRAAAALRAPFTDQSYSEELANMRAQTGAARNRAGSAGIAADIAGSVVVPGALAKRGITMIGRGGTAAMTGAKGVAARAGLAAGEGAAYGTAQAAGRGEDIGDGAIFGAVGGGAGSVAADVLGGLVRGGSAAYNKLTGKNKPIPDMPGLRDAAKKAYDQADNAGVIIKPEPMKNLYAQVEADLADFGYDPELQGRIMVVLKRLKSAGDGNITLKGLDTIRKIANNARVSQDPSEGKLGSMIINRIDDFIDGMNPQDILTGNGNAGASALKEARSLWQRVSKNEKLFNAVEQAKNRAATSGSGGNVENATRQNVRKLFEKGSGWTPDERVAMQEIMYGSPGQNTLRLLGKLSPGGNGLMAALGIGGTMANPAIGGVMLSGMGAKALADRGVRKSVEALDELIRSGGSKEALSAFKGTLKSLSQSQRETIVRVMMNAPGALARQPSQ